MKILFVIPYYKPAYIYGGPIVVVSMLAERLVAVGHDVTVYSTAANGKSDLDVQHNEKLIVNGVKVVYFEKVTGENTFVSFKLWKVLSQNVANFDVVHIHTWWNFLAIGATLICNVKGVKPIMSPHGMFSDYILHKSNSFIKNTIQKLIGKRILKKTWLHVSSHMEWNESQKIIPGWKGEVIPNLVKLPDNKYTKPNNTEFTIGFLSRIDPKKGLDLLIRALSRVNFPYKLLIGGLGDDQYICKLKTIAVECGNDDKIDWVGWKDDESKFEFLSRIDLFALTSHSENFAIVIIEALSVGTPVLISDQIGLFEYVSSHDYGWVTDLSVANITDSLNEVYRSKSKIKKVNKEAPLTIKKDYEELQLTNQYLEFYNWVNQKRKYN